MNIIKSPEIDRQALADNSWQVLKALLCIGVSLALACGIWGFCIGLLLGGYLMRDAAINT